MRTITTSICFSRGTVSTRDDHYILTKVHKKINESGEKNEIMRNMKSRVKKSEGRFDFSFTLLTVQFLSHSHSLPLSLSSFFLQYLYTFFSNVPLIQFRIYLRSDDNFANKGKYTSMHIKANVYRLYYKTLCKKDF